MVFSSLALFFLAAVVVWLVFWRVFGYAGSALHRMWVRRTPKGALLHARWQAFRRYLNDFSLVEDSPPASLALWEQFLIYGIVHGVAEQVLDAARLHSPPEIAQGGSFYGPGFDGSVSGPYVFSFSELENDFTEAFTPPSSSSSGAAEAGVQRRRWWQSIVAAGSQRKTARRVRWELADRDGVLDLTPPGLRLGGVFGMTPRTSGAQVLRVLLPPRLFIPRVREGAFYEIRAQHPV